jgi:hypothetical protein
LPPSSSDVAANAVVAADTATAPVAKLGESSAEMGNVVKAITSISECPANLLGDGEGDLSRMAADLRTTVGRFTY